MRTIRHTAFLAIFSAISFSSVTLADKPATQSATAMDLTGPWKGVFAIDLSTTYLADLDLKGTDDHGGLSGEIHFTPVVINPARARMAEPMAGGWRVSGTADPGTRTLTLMQKGWVKQPPNQQFSLVDMGAIYSAGRDEFAGQFVRRDPRAPNDLTYFLFIRAGPAPDRAQAVENLKKLAEHTLPPSPVRRTRDQVAAAAPIPPTEAALIEWAARYDREYPGSATKDRTEKIMAQSLPLLNDATFKPVFGDTYDAVDFQMLTATVQRLHGRDPNAARGTVQRPNVEFIRANGYLEYVIHPNPPRIISVAAMRTIDAWQAESLARFRTAAVNAATYDDLAATQKALNERMAYAWPSDRKLTEVAFEQIRNQAAGAGVVAMADRAVAAASGMAGVKMLAGWEKANASALAHADPASRSAAQERVNGQLDKLLTQLLEPYEARLAKLGSGIDAVWAGARWHREMVDQFTFVAPRPPCQQIMNRFAARRAQDLADAQPMLLLRIEKGATPIDIERVFYELSFPTDSKSPGYPLLVAAKENRLKAIEVEQLMATFSEAEQKMMDRPGHIDLTKYKQTAPSPEECRLALLRLYAANNGKMIDAHTSRYNGRLASYGIPFAVIFTATGENVLAFYPSKEHKGYFEVKLEVLLRVKMPDDNVLSAADPNTRKGANLAADLFNGVNAALAEPQDLTIRLEEDGWQVLGSHEMAAVEAAIDKMFKKR